jgi:hypothetical protein
MKVTMIQCVITKTILMMWVGEVKAGEGVIETKDKKVNEMGPQLQLYHVIL